MAVPVFVAAAKALLRELTLASATLALLASTPVPAASPMTAAAKTAMMAHSTTTSAPHPHRAPPFFFLLPTAPAPDGLSPGCAPVVLVW